MPVRNRVREFIEKRGITAYRFWKDTGLSRPTAYRVCADADYPLAGEVLEKICRAYDVQPGDLLYWEPDDEPTPAA
jgi:DNA-binding Xre family transcriptional regulator